MSDGEIAKAFDTFLGPNKGEGMDMRELFNMRAAAHVGAHAVLQVLANTNIRVEKLEDWDMLCALKKEIDVHRAEHRLWMKPPANNLLH